MPVVIIRLLLKRPEKVLFLTTAFVLSQFGGKQKIARRNYGAFILKGVTEGRRSDFYQGKSDSRIFGDDNFTDAVLNRKPVLKKIKLDEIVAYVCKQYKVDEKELLHLSRRRDYSEVRGIIGILAVQLKAAPLADVAKRFHRDLSTLSRVVRNIEKKAARSEEYAALLEQYQKELASK